jgi:8-oxo-dGTP diphosphatase
MEVSTITSPPGTIRESDLTYVVIGAHYRGDWIFVRHRDRETWEMPAGHIEQGESADQAAVRELYEEAGAVRSSLDHICDYSVTFNGKTEFGRLYGAMVEELEPGLEFEIEERLFTDSLPQNLTYPDVQTVLFNSVILHYLGADQS